MHTRKIKALLPNIHRAFSLPTFPLGPLPPPPHTISSIYSPTAYFKAYALPNTPSDAGRFIYNHQPISSKNPFGLVQENSNHQVFRVKCRLTHKVFYLKNLMRSLNRGPRESQEAQYLAYEESLLTSLMYILFGPELIPEVFPVVNGNQWGIASSEILHHGTIRHLARMMGYSDKEIFYDRITPCKVIEGKTYLIREGETIRFKQRIAFKIGLRFIGHYDEDNYSNNIFAKLFFEEENQRIIACPGMYDLGNGFGSEQIQEVLQALKDPYSLDRLSTRWAKDPVEAHTPELNVENYEFITNRFPIKQAAFRRIAEFPSGELNQLMGWFRDHIPLKAKPQADLIKDYLVGTQVVAENVMHKISLLMRQSIEPRSEDSERIALRIA